MLYYSYNGYIWILGAMDSVAYQDYFANNTAQPSSRIFYGGGLEQSIYLAVTSCLLVVFLCVTFGMKRDPTRTFGTVIAAPILLNLIPRITKNAYLASTGWPDVNTLFVLTTIEMTLHLILNLNIALGIFIYMTFLTLDLRKNNGGCSSYMQYVPVLVISTAVSIVHFNFNRSLRFVPFLLNVFFTWLGTLLTSVMLVIVTPMFYCKSENAVSVQSRKRIRWIYVFCITATAPTVYQTFMTVIDVRYEFLSSYTSNPSSYINMASYRYYAYVLNPIFLLASMLLVLPSYRVQLFGCGRKAADIQKVKPSSPPPEIAKVTTPPHKPRHLNQQLWRDPIANPHVPQDKNQLGVPNPHPQQWPTKSRIQQVTPGNLAMLDPLIFPGAAPMATNLTVIRGGLDRLDPDIYPGAAASDTQIMNGQAAGHVLIILAQKQAQVANVA